MNDERKEREVEEQRKAEQERRLREEAERLRVLDSEMAAWQKARMIRAYITDVRERALQTGICNEEGSDLAKWISWVSEQADRIRSDNVKSPNSISISPRRVRLFLGQNLPHQS